MRCGYGAMSRKPGFDFWGYIAKKVDAKERELGLDPEPYPLVGIAGLPGLKIPLSGSSLSGQPSNLVQATPDLSGATPVYPTPQYLTPSIGDLSAPPLLPPTIGPYLVVVTLDTSGTGVSISSVIDKPTMRKFGLVGDEIVSARWYHGEAVAAGGETLTTLSIATHVIVGGTVPATDLQFRELFYQGAGKVTDYHMTKLQDFPLDLTTYTDAASIYEVNANKSAAVQSMTVTARVCLEILGRHKFA